MVSIYCHSREGGNPLLFKILRSTFFIKSGAVGFILEESNPTARLVARSRTR
ncbi:MAG: hypothetical protein ACD_81C00166G0004 [uncultured bacterium]|uniref:Uncharacterized protein n=2 Tax=Candidatus Wolfeibacteriota TaxID=1752735 RepID=A0A0G1JH39_9BACT|nr:MAG: hypothetical protein ACD_81C00166G0004 [uncultured bacterium]KKR12419.1 MAG: hypothetical protein UT41_C0002G0193 [Candidatus Wolfebacteria bacterium GW2011_GWC2_39_22]KKT43327.1 MAG: hypothetical protein UW32_C0002G0188 [Candidatus Wolfebacteria bacterium GW2011_GWE2_44_13]